MDVNFIKVVILFSSVSSVILRISTAFVLLLSGRTWCLMHRYSSSLLNAIGYIDIISLLLRPTNRRVMLDIRQLAPLSLYVKKREKLKRNLFNKLNELSLKVLMDC